MSASCSIAPDSRKSESTGRLFCLPSFARELVELLVEDAAQADDGAASN